MAALVLNLLGGFELRTGVEKVAHPDRYRDDKRGGPMWDRVMGLLPPRGDLSRGGPGNPAGRNCPYRPGAQCRSMRARGI